MKRRLSLNGSREHLARFCRTLLSLSGAPLQCSPRTEPFESRIVLSSLATFTDASGDIFSVKVRGPGTAEVVQVTGVPDRGFRCLAQPHTDDWGSLLVASRIHARFPSL